MKENLILLNSKQINDAPEIVIVPDKNDDNKLKQMLKYEIYEGTE